MNSTRCTRLASVVSLVDEIEARQDVVDALSVLSRLGVRLQRVALLRALGLKHAEIAELTILRPRRDTIDVPAPLLTRQTPCLTRSCPKQPAPPILLAIRLMHQELRPRERTRLDDHVPIFGITAPLSAYLRRPSHARTAVAAHDHQGLQRGQRIRAGSRRLPPPGDKTMLLRQVISRGPGSMQVVRMLARVPGAVDEVAHQR